MPLSELYRMARENLDSQEVNRTCATNQSSAPENDFFELVWENGQISMQGHSSRARRSPTSKSLPSHCLPSHSAKIRDEDVGNATDTRIGKSGDLNSGLNEIPTSVPIGEVDLIPDEGMTSWLNYTIDDFLQHDYNSQFLHELTGDTVNEIPASDDYSLRDKRHNYNQEFRDCHRNLVHDVSSSEHGIVSAGFSAGEVETTRTKVSTSPLHLSSSQQCQASFTSIRSKVSDITENNTGSAIQHSPFGEITQVPSASGCFSSLKMQKHDPIMPSTSSASTIINFSHFARPAAIMRANVQSMGKMSGLSSARSEGKVHMNIDATATSSNPPESTFIGSRNELPRESNIHCQQELDSSKADLKPFELKYLEQKGSPSEQSNHVCKKDTSKDDQTSSQVLTESGTKGHTAVEKSTTEQVVASSSVCSGNGVEMFSDNSNQNLKRKSQDTEESECHSEDVEEESGFVRKAAPAWGSSGSKRSRAAEVHNLSERRRRDRINEKMRALQELIPNCNKVDKASMLDEAIEYLKTLQLQVQMMSMGAGLYMPTMMLSHGMQHMHSPMSTFPPVGVGLPMGLGIGYAMGMPDVTSGSSRFPMIHVPQMRGTHLSLHGMTRSNPQVFGLSGQGFPIPVPRAPVIPLSGAPLMNPSALGLNASGTTGLVENMDSASTSGLKDPVPNVNSQVMQGTGGSNPTREMSTQCEAANVGLEESAFAHNSGHTPNADDKGVVNPGKEDNLVTS